MRRTAVLGRRLVNAGCLLLPGLLAGCVDNKKIMDSWLGSNVSEIVLAWGAPQSALELPNGDHAYTWIRDRSETTEVSCTKGAFGNIRCSGGERIERFCRRTFIADSNGMLKNWSYRGC